MGFWSLASMGPCLGGLRNLVFAIARFFFLGLGEAGSFPPAAIKADGGVVPTTVSAPWPREIFNSGANIGAILAPALIPWITPAIRLALPAFLATGILWRDLDRLVASPNITDPRDHPSRKSCGAPAHFRKNSPGNRFKANSMAESS